MNGSNGQQSELWELLEALGEDRMTPRQEARLERLVLTDSEARRTYLDYIDLHGALYWDTAIASDGPDRITPFPTSGGSDQDDRPASVAETGHSRAVLKRGRWAFAATALLAVLLLVAVGLLLFGRNARSVDSKDIAAESAEDGTEPIRRNTRRGPLKGRRPGEGGTGQDMARSENGTRDEAGAVEAPEPDRLRPRHRSIGSPVAFVNEQVQAGWMLAGIEPSPKANDGEWMRRVYLDIAGRIPTAEAVERFLNSEEPGKRSALIEDLLDDPAYVDNWTTIWTNLLIGRAESPDVNRPALRRFLRRAFGENRPWDAIVYELVAAEGDFEKNGATNFLLAHLNNQAVPATAITARLFLGMQVQCTQCHHHPFNQWKQNQFWELNSFFQQTRVVRDQKVDPQTGNRRRTTRLQTRPVGGPIFYEDRRGLLKAALPRFAGVAVSQDADVNRRERLARLITEGDNTQVARAMVNRMWQHFFGYGFTRPVDDMGPHNTPTHPALLEGLSRKFVESGYDLKQLIRWICNSQPYQLTSRLSNGNKLDDPTRGDAPLFSRMYVKSMTAEQLYDSLLVATRADKAGRAYWAQSQRRRERWLQQFVIAFDTEENDEATLFNGTVPQALELMNGELIRRAVSAEPGTYLHEVVTARTDEAEKIRRLFLAALSRRPTLDELAACRKLLRERTSGLRGRDRQTAYLHGFQDLFWASLNSSEFVLVH